MSTFRQWDRTVPSAEASTSHLPRRLFYDRAILFGTLALLVMMILRIFEIWPLGFVTRDDMGVSLASREPVETWLLEVKRVTRDYGRVFWYYSLSLYRAFYSTESETLRRGIVVGSVIANGLLLAACVGKLLKSIPLGLSAGILFFAFLQNSWDHGLVSAYPFVFQLSVSFVLVSLFLFDAFSQSRKKVLNYLSAFVLFAAYLNYENFLLYFLIFPAITLVRLNKFRGSTPSRSAFHILVDVLTPQLIVTSIYLLCYFSWRRYFGTGHGGNTVQVTWSKEGLTDIFRVIWNFSAASLPGHYITHPNYVVIFSKYAEAGVEVPRKLYQVLQQLRLEWVLTSVLTTTGLLVLALKLRHYPFRLKSFLCVTAIGIFAFFCPNLFLAITPRFQAWAKGGTASYTTTYYSFFGLVLILTQFLALSGHLMSKGKIIKTISIAVSASLIFYFSLLVSFSNYYISKSQAHSNLKWKAVTGLAETEAFAAVPEGSIIIAPSLFAPVDIAAPPATYWTDYSRLYLGRKLTFLQQLTDLPASALSESFARGQLYYLKFSSDIKTLEYYSLLSNVTEFPSSQPNAPDSEPMAIGTQIHLFSASPQKVMWLEGRSRGKLAKVAIDGVLQPSQPGTFRLKIDKKHDTSKLVHTLIKAQDLELSHLRLSYFPEGDAQ